MMQIDYLLNDQLAENNCILSIRKLKNKSSMFFTQFLLGYSIIRPPELQYSKIQCSFLSLLKFYVFSA
jgi:hypothetical protein